MFRASHLQRAAELLGLILTGRSAADKHMDQYFRGHREMGARDRGYVAETLYGVLRNKRVLDYTLSGTQAAPLDLIELYLLIYGGMHEDELKDLDRRKEVGVLAQRANALDFDALPEPVRANLPDWLWDRLVADCGTTEAMQLALALNQAAPVDLRINPLSTTREALRDELARAGYASELTPYSPYGLRRKDRKPLFATDAFKSGRFEIQDEGSQLLSLLLEAQPRERVVDFCAGGGGKTLHLGALMRNSGTLYAFDVHAKRLEQMKPRLRRANLGNVRATVIKNERDPHVKRLRGTIDRVLVDAPCSGTGTVRRNPDIKWRDIDLDAIGAQQRSILAAAALLLKPGGRLVYATCSVLRAENECVVDDFLNQTPEFARMPVNEALARCGVPLVMPETDLRLYPHRHGTDGFYAAILVRR